MFVARALLLRRVHLRESRLCQIVFVSSLLAQNPRPTCPKNLWRGPRSKPRSRMAQAILSMVAILLKDLDTEPAPIDAVAVDQPILDLHHLDEIHLLAVRRRARIFPHQLLAIGEETAAIA